MLQELKGNIRVFCRVRPLLPDDNSSGDGKLLSYPTSTEALGRAVDILQNGNFLIELSHCYIFLFIIQIEFS